jgi:hypothetical protein
MSRVVGWLHPGDAGQMPRSPSRVIVFVFWIGLVVLLYSTFEIASRLTLSDISSTAIYLNATTAYIKKNHLTVDQFVRQHEKYDKRGEVALDRVIGWDKKSRLYLKCSFDPCVEPIRILFLGDSVTAGYRGAAGKDYVSLIARADYPQDIEILNAAVPGYGVYQMMIKAERELASFNADIIILSYIDNDLIRPASNFMWGKTRPTFVPTDDALRLVPPRDLEAVIQEYERAWNQYYFGLWMVQHVWGNRWYYARSLYPDYFASVYDWILARFQATAAQAGSRLLILRLPQAFDFYGREEVTRIFASVAHRQSRKTNFDVLRIDHCVHDFFRKRSIDFEKVMGAIHPPPVGHEAYARCLHRELFKLINARY